MRKNRWSDSRRESFYAELHALLTAGLDFSYAFRLLIDCEHDSQSKMLLTHLYNEVVEGKTLWQAMEHSREFRKLECGVIRIGEETGRLAETLDFLNTYFHKRASQRKLISSAVSYPIVILVVAGAVVTFMLSVVVPMFAEVYMRMGGELPALTRNVVSFAQAFPGRAAIIILFCGGIGMLWYMNREKPRVQSLLTTMWMRLPLIGTIVRKNYESQTCRLLHLLISSGVPLLTAVLMLRDVVEFWPYRQSFGFIAHMLERGESFVDGLAHFPNLYDRKLLALVHVGEETGRLPEMLCRRADTLTIELEYAIRRMGSMLEPLLILLVGILVAIILIAMYLPMFSLGGIMG